jgi:hypothetical protein
MEKNCSICQTSISPDNEIKICERCKSAFHVECWNENNGCATYGCENTPKIEKKHSEQFQEYTYWGAKTKKCPMCGEPIKVYEIKCPYCKEQFDTTEPISREDINNQLIHRPHQVEGSKEAIIIFICGILGITAPFNLLFGGIWYKNNKGRLKEESPIYNLLAIVGLSISVVYSLFILLAILID